MECVDIEGLDPLELRCSRLLAEADERMARLERLVAEAEADHRTKLSRSARQRKLLEKGAALLRARRPELQAGPADTF
ncbi:MAG TPA: hypothetical protein VH743_23895 [Beijerinckiaceae bacterium]|jgi:hypothetical protein